MKRIYNSCYGQNIDENDNLKNGLVSLLRLSGNIKNDNSSTTCEVHYVIHLVITNMVPFTINLQNKYLTKCFKSFFYQELSKKCEFLLQNKRAQYHIREMSFTSRSAHCHCILRPTAERAGKALFGQSASPKYLGHDPKVYEAISLTH